MKFLAVIPALIEALYRGRQLSHVETWKSIGVATSAVSGLLAAIAGIAVSQGWLDEIPIETITGVSSGLVTLVSAVLTYLQVATTKKIGLAERDDTSDASDPDLAGDSGLRSDELQARSKPKPNNRDSFGAFGE
jgi:hypothetical protein